MLVLGVLNLIAAFFGYAVLCECDEMAVWKRRTLTVLAPLNFGAGAWCVLPWLV